MAVFVVSSWTGGTAPPAARPFFEWINSAERPAGLLTGLKYCLFGLGDSAYGKEDFCGAARALDKRLVSSLTRQCVRARDSRCCSICWVVGARGRESLMGGSLREFAKMLSQRRGWKTKRGTNVQQTRCCQPNAHRFCARCYVDTAHDGHRRSSGRAGSASQRRRTRATGRRSARFAEKLTRMLTQSQRLCAASQTLHPEGQQAVCSKSTQLCGLHRQDEHADTSALSHAARLNTCALHVR